jgi:hypothetical protein
METASGKETIIVLRRLIAYSEKIFQLSKDIVTVLSDRREKPRISTAAVVKSSLVLFWARMGSSNAWEQVGRARFWQRWLGQPAFSAALWDVSMLCSMPTGCGKGFTTFTSV